MMVQKERNLEFKYIVKSVACVTGLFSLVSGCESRQNSGEDTAPTKLEADVKAMEEVIVQPEGLGQLSENAAWFTAGKDEFGHSIEYNGQSAQNGKIILTASNGFFDRGIRSNGESDLKDKANGKLKAKGHPPLIAADYANLGGWNQSGQSMRWHMYLKQTGSVKFSIKLKPNRQNPDGEIVVSFAGQQKRINPNDAKALKDGLVFQVATKGKQTLQLTAETADGQALGTLSTIDVYGPAVTGAKLLRARWRPAAVHGGYKSSKTEDTTMWVMVSKSLSTTNSYSPMVTPFGYYGGSFGSDQRFQGDFNFSMWSNENAPLTEQAHLLALGDPTSEFSGFGHEGTGVKPRGWSPLEKSRPREVVQCLRVDRGEKYNTYYGYFLEPESNAWKLIAVGRKWVGAQNVRKRSAPLWPSSFVEVLGPPQVQRSGDLVRKVVRKGWCIDSHGDWQRLDILPTAKRAHSNKSWGATNDGWFVFQMGGMEHFTGPAESVQLPAKFLNEPLPDFLSPEKTKQLYQLPVEFGEHTSVAGRHSATLNLSLKDAGTNASAIVYYGLKDCITFAPRKKSGTERKHSTLKVDRIWQDSQEVASVKNGLNKVVLENLKSNKEYYYRVLIHNDQGKMWQFESGSFTTK